MATRYGLKRIGNTLTPQRQFSVLDGVGNAANAVVDTTKNVAGGALKTGGDLLKSGIGKAVGTIAGAKLGGSLFGVPGAIVGAFVGNKGAKNIGQGLSNAGTNLQM